MRRYVALVSMATCLLGAPYAARADAVRAVYVIAIGNNLPPADSADLETLRYADDDALRFFELFGPKARGRALLATLDADSRRRHPKAGAEAVVPSYEALKQTLQRFGASMREDRARGMESVLFLTFSGHGASDEQGEPFLSLLDVPLTRTRLYNELLPVLDGAPAHLIIDACRADGVLGVRGQFDVELEGKSVPLGDDERKAWFAPRSLARFPRVGALAASSADQSTHEWSHLEGGVFSHEVLSALRGAADANGDLRLAYSEVEAFISAANRDALDARTRPTLITHPPHDGAGATLLDLRDLGGVRFLHGDAGKLGHFYIELDNGERLLDAHLSDGYRVALAIPTQRDAFVQASAGEAELEKGGANQSFATLTLRRKGLGRRGSAESSLRASLWRSAYGPAYYRGFVDSTGQESVSFESPSTIPSDSTRARSALRRKLAVALASVAGASAVAFVASTWLTVAARNDFEATDQERRAHALREIYHRRLVASFATGSLAVLALAGGAAVWPWFSGSERRSFAAGVAAHAHF